MKFEDVGSLRIAHRIAAYDVQGAVVAPLVGIADTVGNGLQLHQRLLLGIGAHPRKILNILSQGFFQRVDHREGALLAFGPERFFHIFLAERLA